MNLSKDFKKRMSEVVDMWQEESEKRLEADEKIIKIVQELCAIIEKV